MAYEFPPDLDERVKAEMEKRGLPTEDDVLREAMNALDQLEQDKVRRWNERNEIAIEQSRERRSKPLDLDAMLGRVEQRIAERRQDK